MQQHQYASSATGLHLLAQCSLRAQFESHHSPLSGLRPGLDRVDFVEDADLTTPGSALDLPVLMPVTSEFQAEALRAVRIRHPLALLVAVTNDVSGHQTYYAIRSGANFVLNLAIPGDRQLDMLYAQCRAHRVASSVDGSATWLRPLPAGDPGAHYGHTGRESRGAPGGTPQGLNLPGPALAESATRARTELDTPPAAAARRAAPDPAAVPEQRSRPPQGPPAAHRTPPPQLPDSERELLQVLCTSATVNEIARRHYCSERSMYRRIRRLYDGLGVAGRAELLMLAAGWGLAPPVPARAC
ncbi:hypothetical protein [Streptomyces sp. NPDC048650]|uniref:helix-turn-helix transcriptional regulator n=1 Tax=unclassified Streptomyces TaxID=2593676 RepID=UPI0037218836